MRKLLFWTLFFWSAPALAMPITFDNSNAQSILSQTYNCQGATKTALVVHVLSNGVGSLPSGITYAGVSMTKSQENDQGITGRASLYTLLAPASGSNNVVITFAGAQPTFKAYMESFDGVGAFLSGTSQTVALTPTAAFPQTFAYGYWQSSSAIQTGGAGSGWSASVGTIRNSDSDGLAIDYVLGDTYLTTGTVYTTTSNGAFTGASIQMAPATIGLLVDIFAYAHRLLPFIDSYSMSGNTATRMQTPTTLPPTSGVDAKFSPGGAQLNIAVTATASNRLFNYIFDGLGIEALNPTPVATPEGSSSIAISPDGNLLVQVGVSGSHMNVYTNSGGGVWALAPTPAQTPSAARSVAFDPTGKYFAVGTTITPFIFTYSVSGIGVTARQPTPGILPAGAVNGVAWSHSGNVVAWCSSTSPYLGSYTVTAGVMTANPATTPYGNTAQGIDWSPDDTTLAYADGGGTTNPETMAYNSITGIFSLNPTPVSQIATNGANIRWDKTGLRFAVSFGAAPSIRTYRFTPSTGVAVVNSAPAATPPGDGSFPGGGLDWTQLDESFTPTVTPTFSSTVTPTFTPTSSVTATPTSTSTNTPTATPTQTPTSTSTPTITPTFTTTATQTPTSTITPSITQTWTNTSTATPTFTSTVTPTSTHTQTSTTTPTFTATPTFSRTITQTWTHTQTSTATPTITQTWSSTSTSTRTSTLTSSRTITATFSTSPTRTATPTPSAVCTFIGQLSPYATPGVMWTLCIFKPITLTGPNRLCEIRVNPITGSGKWQAALYQQTASGPHLVASSIVKAFSIPPPFSNAGFETVSITTRVLAAGDYLLAVEMSDTLKLSVSRPGSDKYLSTQWGNFPSLPKGILPNYQSYAIKAYFCSY